MSVVVDRTLGRVGLAAVGSLALALFACAPSARAIDPLISTTPPGADVAGVASSAPSPPPLPRRACDTDLDCGYDVRYDRCDADSRLNRQPPMVDQGIICYCGDSTRVCERLRVWPVPCESNESCAVAMEPRPHPAAASRERPHERGKPCRDYRYSTTCEHKNICLMHTLSCQ